MIDEIIRYAIFGVIGFWLGMVLTAWYMGSNPTAASGRKRKGSEWQGSVSEEAAPPAMRAPGTPTGEGDSDG